MKEWETVEEFAKQHWAIVHLGKLCSAALSLDAWLQAGALQSGLGCRQRQRPRGPAENPAQPRRGALVGSLRFKGVKGPQRPEAFPGVSRRPEALSRNSRVEPSRAASKLMRLKWYEIVCLPEWTGWVYQLSLVTESMTTPGKNPESVLCVL